MSKIIRATSPTWHRPVDIAITSFREVMGGGNDPKRLILGAINGKPISFIERLNTTDYPHDVEDYIANWKQFKKAGLPVVPWLLRTHYGSLLTPDLKADGSELYGPNLYAAILNERDCGIPRERPRPAIDKLFVEIVEKEQTKIRQEAKKWVRVGDAGNVTLLEEDPFQHWVRPNGSWTLMCLDLIHVPGRKYDPRWDRPKKFLETLTALKDELAIR